MANFDEIQAAYLRFPDEVKSLILSTVNAAGQPHGSYAPFVYVEGAFYIFTSGLSAHTQNLQGQGKAAILLIEDEEKTPQIFARRRLAYDCSVSLLERNSPPWERIADQFQTRFGNIIEMLRQLGDFQIFQLQPYQGRFVVGFGAAYDVDDGDMSRLIPPTDASESANG